jgi:hypothetical protein
MRYIVISYCDDQQQTFFDVIEAENENAAKEKAGELREYAVPCEALNKDSLLHLLELIDPPPAVLVAACLAGVPCRYHGQASPPRKVLLERLNKKYRVIPVCPEQLGGLPTPRAPSRWRDGRLMSGGQDVTKAFEKGAALTLEKARSAGAVKFYGLAHSPSCDKVKGITACLLAGNGIEVFNG